MSNRVDTGPMQKNITLVPEEILTGHWSFDPVANRAGTFTETACGSATNAVRVIARSRSDLSQGSVIMSFANIFGIGTVNPVVIAVATVGYLNTIPAGTPGAGWLAGNKTYMDRLWNDYFKNYWADPSHANAPYTGQDYYFVLQPAKGTETWQTADNTGWSLPQGNLGGR